MLRDTLLLSNSGLVSGRREALGNQPVWDVSSPAPPWREICRLKLRFEAHPSSNVWSSSGFNSVGTVHLK